MYNYEFVTNLINKNKVIHFTHEMNLITVFLLSILNSASFCVQTMTKKEEDFKVREVMGQRSWKLTFDWLWWIKKSVVVCMYLI